MSKTSFTLAPELKRDCIELADWPLCKVLLLNDSQYPWFVLVPRIAGLKEIIDLTEQQQITYLHESAKLSHLLMEVFNPDKLNVAALLIGWLTDLHFQCLHLVHLQSQLRGNSFLKN